MVSLSLFWFAIVFGALIALGALGLTLLFGVMDYINVAYAEYITIGGYLSLIAYDQFSASPLALLIAAIVGILGGIAIALLTERLLLRHFQTRPPVVLLIVTLALGLVLRNGVRAVWGSNAKIFGDLGFQDVNAFGVSIQPIQIFIVLLSGIVLLGMYLLMKKTLIGIAMRAMSSNAQLVRSRGIDTRVIVLAVWIIAGAIAGITGMMYGIYSHVDPRLGFDVLLPLFAAVILGGIGDPLGAIAGGFTVGVTQQLSTAVIPPEYAPAIPMVALILGLLIRPHGLFGETTRNTSE